MFDDYGYDLDEYDDSGLVEVSVSTGVVAAETKEAEYMYQAVKAASLSSYMFISPFFITQGFI